MNRSTMLIKNITVTWTEVVHDNYYITAFPSVNSVNQKIWVSNEGRKWLKDVLVERSKEQGTIQT